MKIIAMKKPILFLVTMVIASHALFGQDRARYNELIKEAHTLYVNKEYMKSAETFNSAFVALGNKGMINDRYNAACSWALAGQPDSAFVQLFKIARNGNYSDLAWITNDADLNSLHPDPRWTEVITIITANKEKAEANLDKPLAATLEAILEEDQKYRLQSDEIEQKYGMNSPEMIALWKLISEKDSLNLIKVTEILDTRGWLGADIVGQQGNQALFLVIQHADLETQGKYLPMMREAVRQGKASPSSLALLEDRVALRQGKRQIYGSQIALDPETGQYYVSPLEDPDNVDLRREQVGLGKLADYVSNWGIIWDVEEYKKMLPKLEEMRKERH